LRWGSCWPFDHDAGPSRTKEGKVHSANPKAPDINVLARHYLGCGLSKLPDASKHLPMLAMWESASGLRLDPAKAEAFRKLLR
jgi:hypothetical protein